MIRNYFIMAIRMVRNHPLFSIIHILGLSIGLCAALVIGMIVHREFSFDHFENGRGRIYRVVLDASFGGVFLNSAGVLAPLGEAIPREISGVSLSVPLFQFQGDATAKVSVEEKSRTSVYKNQPGVIFTNGQYFQMLPYRWIAGFPVTALREPFSVVLTQDRAAQFFPGVPWSEIIGRQITYNDDLHTRVSGIVAGLDQNTFFTADEFISLPTIAATNLSSQFMMDSWTDWMAYSQLFIQLAPGTDAKQTEARLASLLGRNNPKVNRGNGNTIVFHLQPLSDVHFNPKYVGVGQELASRETLYGLLALAALLLALGCINFINLSTARGVLRATEIGVRKTLGGGRSQLVMQLLVETLMITSFAGIISLALVPLLLKAFSGFIPTGLSLEISRQPWIIGYLVALVILVTLAAGLYPSFFLSRYRPATMLGGNQPGQGKSSRGRKMLTICQFVAAQFLIVGAVAVSRQIHYALARDQGFNVSAILEFDTPSDTVASHGQWLLSQIETIPGVKLASRGFLPPAYDGPAYTEIKAANSSQQAPSDIQIRWGDTNYLKVYGIKLLAGRNITASDTFREFLINATYATQLGFKRPQDAIGQFLLHNGRRLPIVGVMNDFNELSAHDPIGPLVFGGQTGNTFHILLQSGAPVGAWPSTISAIRRAFRKLYPDQDFEYSFYDQTIAAFYQTEDNLSKLLDWATGLAVLISSMGLLGLVLYTVNTRTKEIGIRKVLGASLTRILGSLTLDFIWPVAWALVIATPLAWWAVHRWLENFAFKAVPGPGLFLVCALAMLILAVLTLAGLALRAARANPVNSLRTT